MQYIVFDLEFNQDFSSLRSPNEKFSRYPFEIIQIGAIKLDASFKTLDTFNRYVKPTIYTQINSSITELTGITTEQLQSEEAFPEVYKAYMEFIGTDHCIFGTWGMSDMKELFRGAEYYNLNTKSIPLMYIDIQPYVTSHLDLPQAQRLNLQAAVDILHILKPYPFHNAYYDAYYTAEILKALPSIYYVPKRYDPNYIKPRPKQKKKVIDFEGLLMQFEKMYQRELSLEEQEMIQLAYKMGKTNQFVKIL